MDNEYVETYDFYATSKKFAEQKMQAVITSHFKKYGRWLHIKNLRKIQDNLWRCNLTYSE